MIALEVVSMLLVAFLATITVLVRDPLRQLVPFGLYGFALAALFLFFHAPDVSLSVIVVGLAYPFMILLALAKVRRRER